MRAAVFLLLLLLLSCSRWGGEESGPPPLDVQVVGRGEIELTCPAGEPPEVRYASVPLATSAAWEEAPAAGPWVTVTVDGAPRLRSALSGLSPLPIYLAARRCGGEFRSPASVVPVVPLRERLLHGRLPGDYFGHAVAFAGDVDGDGYGDLLVGAPWNGEGLEGQRRPYVQRVRRALRRLGLTLHGGTAGAVFLFPGGPGGPGRRPAWLLLSSEEGEFLGSVVAGVGDLNGDGLADVAVGSPGHDEALRNEGAVAVYYGRRGSLRTEPDFRAVGRNRDESFGSAIAGGDFNGDGYSDLAVGAPGSNLGNTNAGAVFVFYGGPRGLSPTPGTTLLGKTFDGLFGSALAAVGDVNGDGYQDLLVGAYEGVADPDAAGAAYLFYGGPTGLRPAPALVLRGRGGGDQFGSALAALGDLDGDGLPDFAVGARKSDEAGEDAGAVYVYRGRRGGPLPEPATVLRGPGSGALFGAALAGAGDLDGDGFPDLLVGAFGAGRAREGKVFLYRGGPGGIGDRPALELAGRAPREHFGRALAGGGDLDGDGRPDLVVGSEGARGKHAGAVSVRH
jgi:hypothetical protein